MANTLANLARMYTETTGTGTLTLTNAVPGFNSFEDAGVADGATITYAIYCGPHREIGAGVWTEATKTLTRATVYSSTSGGAKITLAGKSEVFITPAAEDLASFATDLTAHLNDTAGAHAASAISFSATGGIASTDVQAAIAELDSEKLAAASNLSDLASASTARTNLGLGTAAVQNTGTSGANIPFLNGANTWSQPQTFQGLTHTFEYTDDGATTGPVFNFRRVSASPAVGDSLAGLNWVGKDDAGNDTGYGLIETLIVDPTNGSEDGRMRFWVYQAGVQVNAMRIGLGVVVGSPTGAETGNGTLNAVTLYENGTSLASKYQGLDSELTAIAGLTSAADRLPYFTGSGTAALATFTTAGRNLVDDADASAQRTTLGLGTAATQNTGTSGTNVPLLDGSNTWSAAQVLSMSSAAPTPLQVLSTEGGSTGPSILVHHASASPAAFDTCAQMTFSGMDSAGNQTNYAQFAGVILDTTNGSEDGRFVARTMVAGSLAARLFVENGAYMAGATGTDRGAGTFNATAVYDDSVLLCAPVEFMKAGTVNTSTWDAYTVEHDFPEEVYEEQVEIEVDLPEPVTEIRGQRDGTYKLETITKARKPLLEEKNVSDESGQVVGKVMAPVINRRVVPARKVKRRNELAHEFKAMLDEGFDPRDPKKYFDKMLADEALPGLKTKANWVPNEESNAKRTNRIILALELQTAVVKTLYERLEALEKKVKP